jgi:TolB-like protein/class 3 adenylate cyclase/Tfp pilus assembly protein PilF
MTTPEIKRKLTAILSADVKGYSRLMGEDEKGTVRTLNEYKEVMTGLIQHHHGRVVDSTGDNLMAEFASVVDAVECAVEIQKGLKTRNAELPENRRMEFRIGINLGDVIEEEGRIYGDGVNIAARIESLSEAGGVCISGSAYDFVGKKLPLGYEYLGVHTVKNITEPIRTYQVLMEPEAAGKVIGEKKVKPRQWQMPTIGLVVAVIVIIAAVVMWKFYTPSAPKPEVVSKEKITAPLPQKPSAAVTPSTEVTPKEKVTPPLPEKVSKPAPPPAPKMEVASKEKMAFPLPDKPSIAVLPFVNMSKDAEDDYFGDGLSEDLITALSKTSKLFVIARNSSFGYKGGAIKIKQVSEELGVRYVLEGSVRKAGNRVRITAQLIDAMTGHHLWAERYDRDLKDIFAVQEDITKKIITGVQVQLTEGERARIYGRGTNNLDAYLKAMEATWIRAQTTKENVMKAQQLAQEAIDLDPNYAFAYTALAWTHMSTVWLGITKSPQESLKRAIELCQKAISLDDSLAIAHVALGYVLTMTLDYDRAIAQGEKAMTLEPSSADILQWYASILAFACQFQEAIPMFRESLRLDPNPGNALYRHFSIALRHSGQYDEAIALMKKAIEREPNDLIAYLSLTSNFAMAGRMEEARAAAKEVLRINPMFSVERYEKTMPLKDKAAKDRLIDALRKAGLK